jgi:hypothetical protein
MPLRWLDLLLMLVLWVDIIIAEHAMLLLNSMHTPAPSRNRGFMQEWLTA